MPPALNNIRTTFAGKYTNICEILYPAKSPAGPADGTQGPGSGECCDFRLELPKVPAVKRGLYDLQAVTGEGSAGSPKN